VSPESPDVIVFPGAGSFGGELQALVREFEPSAWLAHYPGRFGKDFGRAAASFTEIVGSCVAKVRRRKPNLPVLVGHSFGAYVAYAAATRLEELGTDITALVVVGATAPTLLAVPESVTRSRSDLAVYLDDLYPESDVSDDWRDVIVDTAMQDLRLLKEFTPSEYPKLRCPIHAARGGLDQLTTTNGISQWEKTTSGNFTHRVFAGGHSDLLHESEFVSWLYEVSACGPHRRT
jgi:surfactin synthase thioesterase subunit